MADASRAARAAPAYPVPPYLPPDAVTVLPWARRYVATLATRHGLCPQDAWDEAVTALLRASLHFRAGAGTFHAYARTAVVRGLWRYCHRQVTRTPPTCSMDSGFAPGFTTAQLFLTVPSTETVVALLLDDRASLAGDVPAGSSQRPMTRGEALDLALGFEPRELPPPVDVEPDTEPARHGEQRAHGSAEPAHREHRKRARR